MQTESSGSIRLTCNWCRYNLIVTEALVPWASSVMLKHAGRQHPEEVEIVIKAQQLKEESDET